MSCKWIYREHTLLEKKKKQQRACSIYPCRPIVCLGTQRLQAVAVASSKPKSVNVATCIALQGGGGEGAPNTTMLLQANLQSAE